MERRVVITGEAAITSIGNSRRMMLDNLHKGVSGIRAIRQDDILGDLLKCRVFGAVDYPIEFNFARHYRKTMGPVGLYACQVAKELLQNAGLDQAFLSSGRLGVAFGSVHGSPSVQRHIFQTLLTGTPEERKSIGGVDYLKSMAHTTAVNIARVFGIKGRIISSCTACTTSSQSIGYGYEAIKYGLQDAMICGGADEYDTNTVAIFDSLLACSTAFNQTPKKTPRPFDKRRDGLVVGEGAGAILLEELASAKRRGAPILAEVVGFYCGNNGGDLLLPSQEGVQQSIRMGLENARLNPADVDLVCAHATATRAGDQVEAQALYSVYGNKPWVTALKSYVGHTMAACGVIETIMILYMMAEGVLFPTLNLDEIDERCAMIRHVGSVREQRTRVASIQNFAFGGVNTCLFIKRFE